MTTSDKNRRYRIPVNQAMLAGTVGLILITVMSIAVTSYLFANRVLVDHARNIMENVAEATVTHSENYLRPAHDAADVAQRLASDKFLDYANPATMENYFFEQLRTYQQFAGIYFGAPDGSFVYVSRNETKMKGGYRTKLIDGSNSNGRSVALKWKDAKGDVVGEELTPDDTYDPRQRPWYKQATLEGRLIWTEPYIFFTSQKPGITTASPVIDDKGNVIGVIGVDIEIAQISNFLGQLRIGQHGKAFVMERDGRLIAFPDISKLSQGGDGENLRFTMIDELEDPISQAAYRSIEKQIPQLAIVGNLFSRFTVDGQSYLSIFKQFKGANKPWVIGLWVPEEDYLGELNSGMTVAALAAVAITILASIFAMAFSRSITNPIRWLREAAEKVGESSFEEQTKHNSIFLELDEALARFEDMRESLRLADEHNKELQEKLIQSTSVKTAFIANVSHELRTPMSAIIGFSDLLERQRFGKLNAEQEDFLQEIRSAGLHLNDMINNLIEMSKIEGGEVALNKEPVFIDQIVDDAMMVLNTSVMQKSLTIEKSLSGLPELTSDKRVCRQIILNILDNAVRYTPDEGTVKIAAVADDVGIKLSIVDTGVGIPEDKIDEVFEPFVQLSQVDEGNLKGTGIGLAIARALVHLMGGTIALRQNDFQGTRVDIFIPYNI